MHKNRNTITNLKHRMVAIFRNAGLNQLKKTDGNVQQVAELPESYYKGPNGSGQVAGKWYRIALEALAG